MNFEDDLEDIEEALALAEDADMFLEYEADAALSKLAACYFMRMLKSRDEVARFYRKRVDPDEVDNNESDRRLLKDLGLPIPRSRQNYERKSAFMTRAWRAVRTQRDRLETEELAPEKFRASVQAFRKRLSLGDIDCELLSLAIALHAVSWFRHVTGGAFGDLNNSGAVDLVARAIRREPREVALALSSKTILVRAGLVSWDSGGPYELAGKLECTSQLARAIIRGEGPDEFLARECQLAPTTSLTLDDFGYLTRETRILVRLLAETQRRGTRGVNVLLYGEPGTGKTELARVLAAAAEAELWEVGCRGRDHGAVSAKDRLRYLRLGQEMLGEQDRPLLLFDEAEDVFPEPSLPFLGLQSRLETRGKAWFNQLLEGNAVPTIWLCNTTEGIDSAHLRRFLYVLEVPRPPRPVRERILRRELAPVGVPDSWITQASVDERLVPGHIARAKRLVEHLGGVAPEEAQEAAEQAIVNTLRATGQSRALKNGSGSLTRYRPEFLNADTDLEALAAGVAARGAGRLCFYGPPGTGKSAFARHLAERAGKELIYRRASDLLSCWVGQTEKQIAEMFQQAERENAAILLDEADSFLASREGAAHSWEVTQVNELLTQFESFDGLFLASTNLMRRLDHASLRRFDLKVRFSYLRSEQTASLLKQVLREHGVRVRKTDHAAIETLARLSNVTPGDFAAVIRRARIDLEAKSLSWWVNSLRSECETKPGKTIRRIGFV